MHFLFHSVTSLNRFKCTFMVSLEILLHPLSTWRMIFNSFGVNKTSVDDGTNTMLKNKIIRNKQRLEMKRDLFFIICFASGTFFYTVTKAKALANRCSGTQKSPTSVVACWLISHYCSLHRFTYSRKSIFMLCVNFIILDISLHFRLTQTFRLTYI